MNGQPIADKLRALILDYWTHGQASMLLSSLPGLTVSASEKKHWRPTIYTASSWLPDI